MSELRACRVCLIMDVRMYDLRTYPLQHYSEPILDLNSLSMCSLPMFACYECAILIKKFYLFREKSLRGQSVLYNILHQKNQITREDLLQIDRENFKLSSCLSRSIETNKNTIVLDHNKIKIETENLDAIINSEVPINLDKVFDDTDKVFEPPLEPEEVYLPTNDCNIKEEISDNDISSDFELPKFDSTDDDDDDDDDEPLVIQKKRKISAKPKVTKPSKVKESKTVRGKGGRPKKKRKSNSVLALTTELLERLTREEEEEERGVLEPKPKKIRKNNIATQNEIEQYCDIIRLSLEEQIEEIKKRENSSNYRNSMHKCAVCFKGFIEQHAYDHHMKKHSIRAGQEQCTVCGIRFQSRRNLQRHALNHEMKYACKSCSYVSKTTTQAKQHQKWHKGVTYKCQHCDEVSNKWTSYLSHLRIKHPSQFICNLCGFSFVSKLGLSMHKSIMHKDEPEVPEGSAMGPFCEDCNVQFVSDEAYKRHMANSSNHSSELISGCRMCGAMFNTLEELRAHTKQEHSRSHVSKRGAGTKTNKDTNFPAKCDHCETMISCAREKWAHYRRVHPDKNYPVDKSHICEICGKGFRANAFLIYHKRTHTSERPFRCAVCPKAFHNRANLHMHIRSHSDQRPHPCNLCHKGFKSKGALDRHFRCHTGVKPYQCEYCGKCFGQSNSRKLHVRTVHLKQPAPYLSKARQARRVANVPPSHHLA